MGRMREPVRERRGNAGAGGKRGRREWDPVAGSAGCMWHDGSYCSEEPTLHQKTPVVTEVPVSLAECCGGERDSLKGRGDRPQYSTALNSKRNGRIDQGHRDEELIPQFLAQCLSQMREVYGVTDRRPRAMTGWRIAA